VAAERRHEKRVCESHAAAMPLSATQATKCAASASANSEGAQQERRGRAPAGAQAGSARRARACLPPAASAQQPRQPDVPPSAAPYAETSRIEVKTGKGERHAAASVDSSTFQPETRARQQAPARRRANGCSSRGRRDKGANSNAENAAVVRAREIATASPAFT